MTFPSFGRLAHLYQTRMVRLFGLFDVAQHPEIAFDPEFQRAAWKVARGMAAEVSHANAVSWRKAAARATRSRQIYGALQEELRQFGIEPELDRIAYRNAELIGSVPSEIAQRIANYSAKKQREGARPAEVEREIRRLAPDLIQSRVRLIARTEVSRAETDLTRARSENMGIDWAQWLTSEDQRVRPSHRNLDKVLMSWSDPPQPEALIGQESTLGRGFAGAFPNCRCLMAPLVSMGEVKWPAKVYWHGRIQRMSRAEFTQVGGVRLAA